MMEIIEDLPADVLGVAARGSITREDYKDVLIPATKEKLKDRPKIKMLFFLGDVDDFQFAALWADAAYGLDHWRNISHLALVSENAAARFAGTFLIPFFPGELRVYDWHERDAARTWITCMDTPEKQAA